MTDDRSPTAALELEPVLAAKYLSELLLPVMRYRVETMGLSAAGAYEFYGSRLQSSVVLPDFEIALVEAIKRELPNLTEIHEIGCGWGQLVFLLAWSGFDTIGFELDLRRFAAAQQFHQILSLIDEPRTRRARFLNEFFPPLFRPNRYGSLAVCDNIVIDNPKYLEEQVIWSLTRYQYSIINVDRFCQVRHAAERPALLARFEAAGLIDRGIFHDADRYGPFHLFERDESRLSFSRFGADNRAANGTIAASMELVRDVAAKVLHEQIARLGAQASGAEAHYSLMLGRGFPLPNYEFAVLEAVEDLPRFDRYCEIGSGLGTLSFLLAIRGCRSLAIEKNRARHTTASLVWQKLHERAGIDPRQCELALGTFPEAVRKLDLSRSLAILTDFVTLQSPAELEAIFAGLGRFACILVDLQRFIIKRERPEQRQELLIEFRRRGFRFERLFRDQADNDYSFALLRPIVATDS